MSHGYGNILYVPQPVKPSEGALSVFVNGAWTTVPVTQGTVGVSGVLTNDGSGSLSWAGAGLSGTFTLAHNTAATDVTGAAFAIATYRGAKMNYVITRGSAITRKGTLEIAGDSTSPSVSDTAASVGAAGITWTAVVSSGNIQIQIATDNSVATSIRLRWEMSLMLEP